MVQQEPAGRTHLVSLSSAKLTARDLSIKLFFSSEIAEAGSGSASCPLLLDSPDIRKMRSNHSYSVQYDLHPARAAQPQVQNSDAQPSYSRRNPYFTKPTLFTRDENGCVFTRRVTRHSMHSCPETTFHSVFRTELKVIPE